MNPLALYPSPLGERTAAVLQAGLTLLDLIFPGRIKARYLTGSSIDGTAVTIAGDALNSSDIDMVIVLRGTLTPLDHDRFAQWRAMCERQGPFHLAQAELRALCRQVLAFEDYCLTTYTQRPISQ